MSEEIIVHLESLPSLKAALEEVVTEISSLPENSDISEDDRQAVRLLLCKVFKSLGPDPTKIDEYIALEGLKDLNFNVSENLHKADIINEETGAHIETKTSKVKKGPKVKVNFNWHFTNPLNKEEVIESVQEKVKDGYALYRIVDTKGTLIREYRFSEEFILAFFSQFQFTEKSTTVNMGSSFCWKCKKCPRLEHLLTIQEAGPPFVIDFSRQPKHTC